MNLPSCFSITWYDEHIRSVNTIESGRSIAFGRGGEGGSDLGVWWFLDHHGPGNGSGSEFHRLLGRRGRMHRFGLTVA